MLIPIGSLTHFLGYSDRDLGRIGSFTGKVSPRTIANVTSGRTQSIKPQTANDGLESVLYWMVHQELAHPSLTKLNISGLKLDSFSPKQGINTLIVKEWNKILPGCKDIPFCKVITTHEKYWWDLLKDLSHGRKGKKLKKPFPDALMIDGTIDALSLMLKKGYNPKAIKVCFLETILNEVLYVIAAFEQSLSTNTLLTSYPRFGELLPTLKKDRIVPPLSMWTQLVKKLLDVNTDSQLADIIDLNLQSTESDKAFSDETIRNWKKGKSKPNYKHFESIKNASRNKSPQQLYYVICSYRVACFFQNVVHELTTLSTSNNDLYSDEDILEICNRYNKWYALQNR